MQLCHFLVAVIGFIVVPKYLRTILNEFEALTSLANGPIIFTYYAEKELSISTIEKLTTKNYWSKNTTTATESVPLVTTAHSKCILTRPQLYEYPSGSWSAVATNGRHTRNEKPRRYLFLFHHHVLGFDRGRRNRRVRLEDRDRIPAERNAAAQGIGANWE